MSIGPTAGSPMGAEKQNRGEWLCGNQGRPFVSDEADGPAPRPRWVALLLRSL